MGSQQQEHECLVQPYCVHLPRDFRRLTCLCISTPTSVFIIWIFRSLRCSFDYFAEVRVYLLQLQILCYEAHRPRRFLVSFTAQTSPVIRFQKIKYTIFWGQDWTQLTPLSEEGNLFSLRNALFSFYIKNGQWTMSDSRCDVSFSEFDRILIRVLKHIQTYTSFNMELLK